MPQVTDYSLEAGGTEITSYNLEYNQALGANFVEVIGETSENLSRTILVATTAGETYVFRYRTKNIFGFTSGYSPTTTIKSAKAPQAVSTINTEISG